MKSLDLPIAYKRGGIIDTDSYLRERVFFEVHPNFMSISMPSQTKYVKVELNDGQALVVDRVPKSLQELVQKFRSSMDEEQTRAHLTTTEVLA